MSDEIQTKVLDKLKKCRDIVKNENFKKKLSDTIRVIEEFEDEDDERRDTKRDS